MQHAAYEGATSPLGMRVGATMAVLGATLALFTANASSARTELLGLYTQQTIASLRVETSSTKYRILETQLRQLHALDPPPAAVESASAQLDAIAATSPEAARAATIARLAVQPVLAGLTPPRGDLEHLARLTRSYRAERDASERWLRTFDEPRERLTVAIEHYEWAALLAELGVVASSLALLLSSRRVWLATLVLGATGLLVFVLAFFPTEHATPAAERAIASAKSESEATAEATRGEEGDDEALLREVEGAERR